MPLKTVVLFGAGATKASGGPLTNEILPTAIRLFHEGADLFQREEFAGNC